jgi:hypothetical protein
MYRMPLNKLLKILYDGGMKPYLWFVVETEVAKELNQNNRKYDGLINFADNTEQNESNIDRLDRLNEDELKFLCLLAESSSLFNVHKKYKIPRRYCDEMYNKIKLKLK